LFNVIKGEMTYQTSKPVIIGKKIDKKKEEYDKNEKEIKDELINLKKNEIESLKKKLFRKNKN